MGFVYSSGNCGTVGRATDDGQTVGDQHTLTAYSALSEA